MSASIQFQGLSVELAGLPVLSDIDLEVAPGELICLVGPSGCGKSTLLNVAGGFLAPSRGRFTINGETVQGPDRRRIFIFQECAIFPWLTVAENIGFGLRNGNGRGRQETVSRWLAKVGLEGFSHAYPRELSGGMRQRVEIARALAANPDVLFMDEPFGALDYLTRQRLRRELEELWCAAGMTILFVTHDVEEAVQLADRIVVLSQRPAAVRTILPVSLPRPRSTADPAVARLKEEVFTELGLSPDGV